MANKAYEEFEDNKKYILEREQEIKFLKTSVNQDIRNMIAEKNNRNDNEYKNVANNLYFIMVDDLKKHDELLDDIKSYIYAYANMHDSTKEKKLRKKYITACNLLAEEYKKVFEKEKTFLINFKGIYDGLKEETIMNKSYSRVQAENFNDNFIRELKEIECYSGNTDMSDEIGAVNKIIKNNDYKRVESIRRDIIYSNINTNETKFDKKASEHLNEILNKVTLSERDSSGVAQEVSRDKYAFEYAKETIYPESKKEKDKNNKAENVNDKKRFKIAAKKIKDSVVKINKTLKHNVADPSYKTVDTTVIKPIKKTAKLLAMPLKKVVDSEVCHCQNKMNCANDARRQISSASHLQMGQGKVKLKQ